MGVSVREKVKDSGVFWVFLVHKDQRRSHRVGPKKEALELAQALRKKLAAGDFDPTSPETPADTFRTYSLIWLDSYVKAVCRRSTHERYGQVLRDFVFPLIGDKALMDVNRGDIKRLLLKLVARDYSRSTIAVVKDVVSGVFTHAVDEELVARNPAAGILKRLGLERDKKGRVEPFNRDEVALFLETCHRHFPSEYPFYLTAFSTGARLGELLALEWSDVDWFGKRVQISKSFGRGRVGKPKNGKARWVDLTDGLIVALRDLLTRRKRQALAAGIGEPIEIIFHREGKHIPQNTIRRDFERILRKAGLRKIRFHDVRHTYISLLVSSGATMLYVMEQAGHHSIKMTIDRYADYIPREGKSEVNLLDLNDNPKAGEVISGGE